MPIYEYKCKTCGKKFEIQQRITEDSLKYCPVVVCDKEIKGEGEVERLISKNVGLVFKGTGFYLTDYAKKSVSTNSKSDSKISEQKVTEPTKSVDKSNTTKSEKTV
jgi:putative FmdB family regulatory protein